VCAAPAPSKLGNETVTSRFAELISTLAGLFISTLAGLKSSENDLFELGYEYWVSISISNINFNLKIPDVIDRF